MNRFIKLAVTLSCLLFAVTSYSQSPPYIKASTEALIQTNSTLDTQLLIKTAKQRLSFIRTNLKEPERIIPFLLPTKITHQLPKEIQPFLEVEISDIEGRIEIRSAISNQHEETQYLLHQEDKLYYLNFTDQPPKSLQTDTLVRINKAFLIPVDTQSQQLVLSSHDLVILKKYLALPLAFGQQSTIAMLVNFSDNPTTQPWTVDYTKNHIFNNINNFYLEASYGQTSFVGQTIGWFTLNMSSTTACTDLPNKVETLADQAAKNSGIDLTQFKRKIYIFPKTASCTWSGLGTVGGSNTRSFVNGSMSTILVAAHELGHNLGLHHAQALRCPTSPIEGSCTVSEYGDGSDTMGNTNPGHFNAFEKERLGWLNYGTSPPITTVTQSGSYFLDAYETTNSRPKALKVLKRSGGADYYYLEFRQPIGFDKVLENCGSNCNYTKGIIFHQGNPSGANRSQLLDMSPGSGNQLVALLPCQNWRDAGAPMGGVTFAVQSISSQGARVKISFGGLTEKCIREAPTIRLVDNQTPWINQNSQASYRLLIKNNDSRQCKARHFEISTVNNPYFVVDNNQITNLKLMPGASQVKTISINSTYTGMPFIYASSITVKDDIHRTALTLPIYLGLHPISKAR